MRPRVALRRARLRWALAAAAILAATEVHAGACKLSVTKDGKPRFEPKADEIIDHGMGLVWQRCSVGLEWKGSEGCVGERAGLTYEAAEAAAQDAAKTASAGWRLPTADELASLVDRDCGSPAIDKSAFPDITDSSDEGAEEYWTSTKGNLEDMMVFIEFQSGYSDIRSPGFERNVRLVRGK